MLKETNEFPVNIKASSNKIGGVVDSYSDSIMNGVNNSDEVLSEDQALMMIEELETELSDALKLYGSIYNQDFSNIECTKMNLECGCYDEKYLKRNLVEIYSLFGGREIPEEIISSYKKILLLLKSKKENPRIQADIMKCIDLFDTFIISMKGGKERNERKIKTLENNELLRKLFYNINCIILGKYIPSYDFSQSTWVDEFNNIKKEDLLKESSFYMMKYVEYIMKNPEEMSELTEKLSKDKYPEIPEADNFNEKSEISRMDIIIFRLINIFK